jgi:hypothetical protein
MYTYRKLSGSSSLQGTDGIVDDVKTFVQGSTAGWFGMPSWVKSYWAVVKSKVNDIIATGPKITAYWQKISYAQQKLVARGDQFHADALGDELKKIADDMQKWSKTKQYIDTYMPQWAMLDQNITVQPGSGVGVVPFVLAGMALTALAYVVNTGMALVQDYAYKSQLTQAVIDQKITTGQMTDILSVPKNEGVFETIAGKVGTGLGFGIPTALLIGGGAYLLFATGGLNTVLKSVGSILGGSSSSQGSGS